MFCRLKQNPEGVTQPSQGQRPWVASATTMHAPAGQYINPSENIVCRILFHMLAAILRILQMETYACGALIDY